MEKGSEPLGNWGHDVFQKGKWPWGISYGSIWRWMNIYLPPILMFTRITIAKDPQPSPKSRFHSTAAGPTWLLGGPRARPADLYARRPASPCLARQLDETSSNNENGKGVICAREHAHQLTQVGGSQASVDAWFGGGVASTFTRTKSRRWVD